MVKKEDLRIRKTKASLYKGLSKLMKDKKLDDIRIIDICTIASVNRSTFYDHFNDINELLTSLMEDSKAELMKILKEIEFTDIKSFLRKTTDELSLFVNNNYIVFSALSSSKNNNSIAYDMLFDVSKDILLDKLNSYYINNSDISNEIIVSFYLSGIINILLNNNNKEDLNLIIDKLIPDFSFLEKKN